MSFRVRPLGSTVVLSVEKEKEQVTSGGIIVPETVSNRQGTYTVVAVGPGEYVGDTFVTPTVAVGDVVLLYSDDAGFERQIDGSTYLFVDLEDIIGVMEKT